ncbi:uncharacterized protein BP5553_01676 [Venustampulla echinocandica]|uniref:Serine hydrolase domain-containing protein n=1 Tax=Venustampulla echinocandica TaxID=2656787 RepID=A0A370U1Q4_9HELO|nr:uncharacterized protein BP5553_01676 [Venustampulla echinocandica]RDL41697.1 hypothetical protein BP5553_01676 [Venustampulla echinocandica]
MRFLCLHGMGTNNQVFEMQTEIKSFFAPSDRFFAYFDASLVRTCQQALQDLDNYIKTEGPFDAVLAFSQGAALASTLLVQKWRQNPQEQQVSPIFKCAVFISGGVPVDPDVLLHGELRTLSADVDGEVIPIPTAHIWGTNDTLFPGSSATLSKLCNGTVRSEFVHEGGHEVPGETRDLASTVHAIKRVVHKGAKAVVVH